MANENVLARPVDRHSMQDTTEYADEGDEVCYWSDAVSYFKRKYISLDA